jgi:hypothetical protein
MPNLRKTMMLALALLLFAPGAEAACVTQGLASNCVAPRGNSYLSQPGDRLLPMPQADPTVVPRVPPERRAPPDSLGRLRGPFPTVGGRVLRHPSLDPCAGALCGRQQRYFPQVCRSQRCL